MNNQPTHHLNLLTLTFSGSLALLAASCSSLEEKLVQTSPPANASPQATLMADAETKPTTEATLENTVDTYDQGLDIAMGAATIGQSATSVADWEFAISRWQTAIDMMQKIPASDLNYSQAQQKITTYKRNLTIARQEIAKLQSQLYQEAKQSGVDAFTLNQSARSHSDWKLVDGKWQEAQQKMQAISANSPYYNQAQQKVAEYRRNAQFASEQASKLDPFSQGLNCGHRAAIAAQSAQNASDWYNVALEWQNAIKFLAQVPSSSPNYDEANKKIAEYQVDLKLASQKIHVNE